jgi:hypothetical protein
MYYAIGWRFRGITYPPPSRGRDMKDDFGKSSPLMGEGWVGVTVGTFEV